MDQLALFEISSYQYPPHPAPPQSQVDIANYRHRYYQWQKKRVEDIS